MKIIRIIFLQGEQAEEAISIFQNRGAEGALQYLDQWYSGNPKDYETFSESSRGSKDLFYEISDYLLTVNTNLPYIGLELIIERDPAYKPAFLSWVKSYEEEVREFRQLISGNPLDVKQLKAEYLELTGKNYRASKDQE